MTLLGRRFRPSLWPTLAALLACALLVALGAWQLQRLQWKERLIDQLAERTSAAPMPLPDDLSDPEALAYRPVRLNGRFLHDRELYLVGRTYRGQAGSHVVTPMALDDGRTILVDRGWVPPERRDSATRPAGQVDGVVTVDGLLRPGGWRGSAAFKPTNQPDERLWVWPDLPEMTAKAGLQRAVETLYVAAGAEANPGGYPIGGQTQVTLRNDHLQYAITWYALAVVLLVIYLLHQSTPVGEDGS